MSRQNNTINILDINKLTKLQFKKLLEDFNSDYHNKDSSISDEEFDLYKELYIAKYGPIEFIGAKPESNLVELPVYLGSLNKLKTEKQYIAFNSQKPFIIESKLDGITGLYYDNVLYTRGNGLIANNISHLIPYLNLPKINFNVRGEFVVKKNIYKQKYKDLYKSERTFVSATINSKEISDRLKDIDFVVYQIIESEDSVETQLKKIKKSSMLTPMYKNLSEIKLNKISETLHKFLSEENYLMDGVVIISNTSKNDNINSNPSNAIAYKENMTKYIVKVLNVIWTHGKTCRLNPTVEFEPILDGKDTLRFATGKSGLFIHDNKIGPGTILEIERAGGIIPHILATLQPTKAEMPSYDYIWKGDNIYTNELSNEVLTQRIHYFIKTYGLKGIGPSICKKLVDNNLNLVDIINISHETLRKIFAEKTSQTIFNAINSIKYDNLIILMDASGIFGEGIAFKTLNSINKVYPILDSTYETLMSIKGISTITAVKIMDGLPLFLDFLNESKIKITSFEKTTLLLGEYVFSGFRDKGLKEKIEINGGIVSENLTKNSILIVKDFTENSKYKKALEYKIKIYTREEFSKYLFTIFLNTDVTEFSPLATSTLKKKVTKHGKEPIEKIYDDIFIDNLTNKKIALFDLDYTLIKPKSSFLPQNSKDYELWNENIIPYLETIQSEYDIVLATNQSKKFKVELIHNFINEMKEIGIIISACICVKHKKPDPTFILECLPNKKIVSHCGDAAGEIDDWSADDKKLAENLHLKKFEISYKYFAIKKGHKRIYLMVGIPGSGKTTTAIKTSEKINAKILHRDELKTVKKILELAYDELKTHDNVIIDACNVDYLSRKVYIEFANIHKYNITAISVITDVAVAIERDALRPKPVGKLVIRNISKRFKKPMRNEGFDELIEISNN